MRYLFHPDELKEGVRGEVCGLDFLSCQRIELNHDHSDATIATGPEEVVLVCIAGQVDYTFDEIKDSARFKDFLQRYPDGKYAANAHYWLGELYLVMEPPDLEAVLQCGPGGHV